MYGAKSAVAATLPFTGLALGWYVAAVLLALFLGLSLIAAGRRKRVSP
jgi:hypothetical protein